MRNNYLTATLVCFAIATINNDMIKNTRIIPAMLIETLL